MARNTENASTQNRNRWSLAIWSTAALLLLLLLLLPTVAMRFTGEVNWTASDFIIMGAMLTSACGAYELLARTTSNTWYRAAVGIAILTAFLTVWVNGAVGMLGSDDNPDNLLFGAVLGVGLIGAILSWFRPIGMVRAMEAAAIAQAAMTVYALVGGYAEVVVHVGLFIIPWVLSAQLFRKAAREQATGRAAE